MGYITVLTSCNTGLKGTNWEERIQRSLMHTGKYTENNIYQRKKILEHIFRKKNEVKVLSALLLVFKYNYLDWIMYIHNCGKGTSYMK